MAILNRRPMTTSKTGKWRPAQVGLLERPAQQAQQGSQQQRSHSGSFQRGRRRKEGESSGGNCRFQLRIILSPNLWNKYILYFEENYDGKPCAHQGDVRRDQSPNKLHTKKSGRGRWWQNWVPTLPVPPRSLVWLKWAQRSAAVQTGKWGKQAHQHEQLDRWTPLLSSVLIVQWSELGFSVNLPRGT